MTTCPFCCLPLIALAPEDPDEPHILACFNPRCNQTWFLDAGRWVRVMK